MPDHMTSAVVASPRETKYTPSGMCGSSLAAVATSEPGLAGTTRDRSG